MPEKSRRLETRTGRAMRHVGEVLLALSALAGVGVGLDMAFQKGAIPIACKSMPNDRACAYNSIPEPLLEEVLGAIIVGSVTGMGVYLSAHPLDKRMSINAEIRQFRAELAELDKPDYTLPPEGNPDIA